MHRDSPRDLEAGDKAMKSPVVKRSIVVADHKTSVSLEDAFWRGLKQIAGGRDMTLSALVAEIDSARQHGNLSSAIRLYVLDFYRDQISEQEKRPRTGEILATATVPIAPKQGY
jgi:predicted DNA-binding ribbon-helix-helix protein